MEPDKSVRTPEMPDGKRATLPRLATTWQSTLVNSFSRLDSDSRMLLRVILSRGRCCEQISPEAFPISIGALMGLIGFPATSKNEADFAVGSQIIIRFCVTLSLLSGLVHHARAFRVRSLVAN